MSDRMEALSKVHRPQLGEEIPISVFRVFRQFSALYGEDILGARGIKTIFQYAGTELGLEVGKTLACDDLDEYVSRVADFVYRMKIGVLSLVPSDDSDLLIFRLDECITCAGMDNIGQKICHFEAGIVGGVVQSFVGKTVHAHESKCNAAGDDCCEVTVNLNYLKHFLDE